MSEDILVDRLGGLVVVTLNRPKALNTLNLEMYRELDPRLDAWEQDPSVKAIVIKGAGGKAFCAGGDVRALWETGRGLTGPRDLKRLFFREEYRLIHKMHHLSKPYVALMNGITMGGGAGMSINGRFRVATDATMFAMPETAIGLVPDVGATRFLRLCPGHIGLYLGLTGARLRAADLMSVGLTTHFVPVSALEALVAALGHIEWGTPAEAADQVAAILAKFSGDPGTAAIDAHKEAIERCFSADSVEGIFAALEREPGDWAASTLAGLRKMSPSSLKLTFQQLGGPAITTAAASLRGEYRVIERLMDSPDFFEGVRALLVDKDQSPRWRPATLDAVDPAWLARCAAPLDADELTFDAE